MSLTGGERVEETLKGQMTSLTARLDSYIMAQKSAVIAKRQEFNRLMALNAEKETALKRQLREAQAQELNQAEELNRERVALEEAKEAVRSHTRTMQQMTSSADETQQQIDRLSRAVQEAQDGYESAVSDLQGHVTAVQTELRFWWDLLKLKVTPQDVDVVCFSFENVRRDECQVHMDLSSHNYKPLASYGDRLPEFRQCVKHCINRQCDESSPDHHPLPWYLRLTLWTCPANCDYMCQKVVTEDRKIAELPMVQFHGKWYFDRFLGVQEPASVTFSILNFLPHWDAFRYLYRTWVRGSVPRSKAIGKLPMYYLVMTVLGMNAWLWSSVFHVRDTPITEKLDYFGAGLSVLYNMYVGFVRLFRLDRPSRQPVLYLLSVISAASYMSHVYFLSFVRFDYSYNMTANVCVGLLQNVVWSYLAWSSFLSLNKQSRSWNNLWALWPFFVVVSVALAMSLELLDFSPLLNILDAHALWHAATVLPTHLWYAWVRRDLDQLQASKIKN